MAKCGNEFCKGWGVFIPSGSMYYEDGKPCVQRCDECNRFANDYQAQKVALKTKISGKVHLYSKRGKRVCTVRTYRKSPERYDILLRD